MARPRKYSLNEAFFDVITPESAYLIGLIQADGTISADRVSITAKLTDEPFLAGLRCYLGSNRPLQHVHHQYGNVVRLAVNSTPIANALKQWGIHSPRTWTASTHPDLLLNRDYWRGVIDGDGTLCVSGRGAAIVRLVGSYPICSQFLAFSRYVGCESRGRVCECKSIFTVCLNGHDAVHIATALYSSATVYLPRKANIYRESFKSL